MILAIEAERKAINANLDSRVKAIESNIAYVDDCYIPLVREFASRKLDGKKARSLVFTHGRIGFRRVKGRTDVNAERAIEWLKSIGSGHLVKVKESVNVSDVLALIRNGIKPPPSIVTQTEGSDKFYVDSGVGRPAEGRTEETEGTD